jgi:hypothetical protein
MTNQQEADERMLMRITDRFVDRLGAQLGDIFARKRKHSPEKETSEEVSEESEGNPMDDPKGKAVRGRGRGRGRGRKK